MCVCCMPRCRCGCVTLSQSVRVSESMCVQTVGACALYSVRVCAFLPRGLCFCVLLVCTCIKIMCVCRS